MSVNLRFRTPPGFGLIVFAARELDFLFRRILHDCLRQRMFRVRVNRGGDTQDFFFGFPVPRNHLLNAGFAFGDRAGLVHGESFQFPDFLQKHPALDEHAASRHRGQTGDN